MRTNKRLFTTQTAWARLSRQASLMFSLAAVLQASLGVASDTAVLCGTVLDAATGSPTACTVTISGADGKAVTDTEAFKGGFRCAGTFEKRLPAGKVRIRITQGFEVKAFTTNLLLRAGERATLSATLSRAVDLRSRGWYAGDSHDHMIHGERTILVDFDFVALTARAEDLQYLSVAHAWQMTDPTPEKLDAEFGRRSTAANSLTWNIESPKNYYKGDAGRCLGHCWNVGMRGRTASGADVIPLLLRASAADFESQKASFANFESHALIHAQGGAVFYTHPLRWWTGPWGGYGGYPRRDSMRVSNMAVELPIDTLVGPTYDGLDVFTSGGEAAANDKAFQLWTLLLNHGYRVAATASSDACFDLSGGAVPGSARTYTYLGKEPFSFAAVARATVSGRTFATTGPLLLATVDGLPPSTAVPADGQAHTLNIEAWASGKDSAGLKQIEIFRNGKPYMTESLKAPQAAWHTNLVIRETEASWYCVRLTGSPQGGRAVSGALFFDPVPYRPPAPVHCRVRAKVVDATDGRTLSATLVEISDIASSPREGERHAVPNGQGVLNIPGTVRLRADVPGYLPLTLSPVLDNPPLMEALTRLEDTDLLNWETFEHLRSLLSDIDLTFKLTPSGR